MIIAQKPYAPIAQRPAIKAASQHPKSLQIKNPVAFGNKQGPLEKFEETFFTEVIKTTYGAIEEFDKHIPLPKNETAHIVVVSLVGAPAMLYGTAKGAVKGFLDLF